MFLSLHDNNTGTDKPKIIQTELLIKTAKSFKLLSDLYIMEARFDSNVRGWNSSKRIIMDENMGSYLFTFEKQICCCIDMRMMKMRKSERRVMEQN